MKKLIMTTCYAIAMTGIATAQSDLSKILRQHVTWCNNMDIQNGVVLIQSISSTHFFRINTMIGISVPTRIDIYIK